MDYIDMPINTFFFYLILKNNNFLLVSVNMLHTAYSIVFSVYSYYIEYSKKRKDV